MKPAAVFIFREGLHSESRINLLLSVLMNNCICKCQTYTGTGLVHTYLYNLNT